MKNNYDINYFITDHLGSTRVIVNANGSILEQKDYYPFGKEHENANLMSSTNRWNFSGKEKQTIRDLGWLDFSARMYANCEMPIFTTQDPLAEKYYSISPYAYCANNPINRIDPTGMIWDDVKEAEKLKQNVDNKITSLNKDISKYQAKIDKGGHSDKQISKLESKISSTQDRISKLETSKADIDKLGADQDHTYSLSNISGGEHHVRQGNDGKVYIETSTNALSLHEISHVRQSLDAGGLEFKDGLLLNASQNIVGITANEVEAYKIQYSFDLSFPGSLQGKGLNGINVHSVGGIMNNGKPVYPAIYNYSIDINKDIKRKKKLFVGGN